MQTDSEPVVVLTKAEAHALTNPYVVISPPLPALHAALESIRRQLSAKLAEPANLGAVAKDANGEVWIRVAVPLGESAYWRSTRGPTFVHWSDLEAAEVLFEGVSDAG